MDVAQDFVISLSKYWRDEFMTWDPEEYDGLDTVYVSVEDIWRPDIVLYNR